MADDRTIELGMLTVGEATALHAELLLMQGAHRRNWGTVKDLPLTGRLIRTLDDELGGPGKGAPAPAPTPDPAMQATEKRTSRRPRGGRVRK